MNSEKLKKRQSFKIIASEAIMVIAVIAIVSVLALIVSGYWLNSDFEVERQGLLQVSSIPTGADISIDGESSWLQRTNTSKVLPSGEHEVVLSKEGYDSWSKVVNITEGLLYRIHYPRLFLKERTPVNVLDISNSTFATISPDQYTMLLANSTTKWQIINIDSEILEPKSIDIAPYFPGVSLAEDAKVGLFSGNIIQADWDQDNHHILFEIEFEDAIEWVLMDVKNPDKSINLTKEFGTDFSSIKIIDHSANSLLAIRNHNLHRIDVSSKAISSILVENIIAYDNYENEILFVSEQIDGSYEIGLLKLGDSEAKPLATIDSPAIVAISKFYDDYYFTVMQDDLISVHQKQNYDQVTDYQLSFAPDQLKVGHHGEFIIAWEDAKIATLDMELGEVREWQIENEHFDWLDSDMVYVIQDGDLIVYDFDGYNRRQLAKNVSSHFPAGITDNKWLYYFSDGQLIREWIVEH